ncbi:hypothetical protein Alches_24520 [Alicyclobacillus hesperidum subsp. aegles]|uniref:Zn-ribbon domain-containing OB-fold protein n=1 Tax=Alicyclobacillus hesperidum TaxID=89784 RepID=UPI0007192A1D|nr:Zn-ribbon domain-containing OB-fold protein [Alicyclobacillus hesperidum]GLG02411.1 hypothetical protein Alches_24520 [Alicyclobacillus hesperidum subsp. aegles]
MTMQAKPVPVLDTDSRPFWEGCRQGVLRIQRCKTCARYVFYPRSICPHCMSDDLVFVEAKGLGTVYTYTVVHRGFGPFQDEVPFTIALVDLDEGVRMMTRIVDAGEGIGIGDRVEVVFSERDDGLVLPYFRPILKAKR